MSDDAVIEGPGFRLHDRGAQVTQWFPAGQAHPVLYSSSLAVLDADHAWRGGIPICAPWFGAGVDGQRTPSHGPARRALWRRVAAAGGVAEHRLDLDIDGRGRAAALELTATTVVADDSLLSRLVLRNAGPESALVEAALHTYLAVSDVTTIEVHGLGTAPFFDKVTGVEHAPEPAIVFGGQIDRVYTSSDQPIEIVDAAWSRTLSIERSGSPRAVVWNPGPDAAPADVGAGEWRGFVCVEAAVVGDSAVTLEPGEDYAISSRIRVGEAPHTAV